MSAQVLLIEDNCDDEFLAIRTLRKLGFKNVAIARDGCEAISLLLGDETTGLPPGIETPAFILLDLRLPKLDGLEVLRKIRLCPRTEKVPVYVLTSSEDPHDRDVCSSLGALAFLPKPLIAEAFRDILRDLMP